MHDKNCWLSSLVITSIESPKKCNGCPRGGTYVSFYLELNLLGFGFVAFNVKEVVRRRALAIPKLPTY